MKKIITIISLSAILLQVYPAAAWEMYDRVIAVVNSEPIVQSEVDLRFAFLKNSKKIAKNKQAFERSRILDKYIEDALVKQTAKEISVIVSNKKVLGHLENMMLQHFSKQEKDVKKLKKLVNNFSDQINDLVNDTISNNKIDKRLQKFISKIEKDQKTLFLDYFEGIRTQMRREQLINIAIGVSPPSEEESIEWYKKNKNKLGFQVWVKHILIRPAGRSFKAERNAAKKMEGIRKRIIKGESFEKLAVTYSQDPGSRAKGGDLGWVMLAELDPLFAGNVFRMKRRGEISRVFKSGFGYHVVKYYGRKAVTYDKVKRMIMYRLYSEKMMVQYKKWVLRRKKESEIKIYMDNYIASNDSGVNSDSGKRRAKNRPTGNRRRRP